MDGIPNSGISSNYVRYILYIVQMTIHIISYIIRCYSIVGYSVVGYSVVGYSVVGYSVVGHSIVSHSVVGYSGQTWTEYPLHIISYTFR